jgi:hypothetical protein
MLLQTGDVIVLNGATWISKVVKCLTTSNWTHCGLVWRDPPHLPDCAYTDEDDGVHLQPLEPYVRSYEGEVWVVRCQTTERERFAQLPALYEETKDRPYNFFLPDALRTTQKSWCGWRARQDRSFVCSTYLAYLFYRLGFVARAFDWVTVEPENFIPPSTLIPWELCTWDEPDFWLHK